MVARLSYTYDGDSYNHYNDVIMGTMGRLKSQASTLFTHPFIQAQIKENTKALRHWPLRGNSPVTGEFPAQKASNAENVPFDDVIMRKTASFESRETHDNCPSNEVIYLMADAMTKEFQRNCTGRLSICTLSCADEVPGNISGFVSDVLKSWAISIRNSAQCLQTNLSNTKR